LKESLKKIVLSSKISKIPVFNLDKEMEHRKKEKGRKAPKVCLLIKGNLML
jgi:hypothetical protein